MRPGRPRNDTSSTRPARPARPADVTGAALRAWRRAARLTQRQAADVFAVASQTWSVWERGLQPPPRAVQVAVWVCWDPDAPDAGRIFQ